MRFQILPSLLAADFGHLADGCRRAEEAGADALHLDIMDGHFVPNLSFGPDVVKMAKRATNIPLDVHLMLTRPDLYIDRFADAGADAISIHVEADCDVSATLAAIRARKLRAGLVVKPKTPAGAVKPFLGAFGYVLVMTVEPGYGGQSFMADMLPKIAELAAMSAASATPFPVMVDGGIADETGARCAKAGATEFVAGSSLYRAPDMAAAVASLRASLERATATPGE